MNLRFMVRLGLKILSVLMDSHYCSPFPIIYIPKKQLCSGWVMYRVVQLNLRNNFNQTYCVIQCNSQIYAKEYKVINV